jgi:hypothetical protein
VPETDKTVGAIGWGLHRFDDVPIRFDGWTYVWAGAGPRPAGRPGPGGLVVLPDLASS